MRTLKALTLLALAPLALAQEGKPAPDRSSVLVCRSLSEGGRGFAAELGPKLAARASSSGVAMSPTDNPEAGEGDQVTAARARGASFLVDVKVTSFAAVTTTLLGQERRRMTASVAWRALDIGANPELAGSGQLTDSSLADAVLPAEEQAAALSGAMAEKVGSEIAARLGSARARTVDRVQVAVRVTADGLSLPSVTVDAESRVTLSKEPLPLELGGFTLACDGVVLGTVPGERPVGIPQGLRNLTLSRAGFETWTARVDVREGLRLEPVLRPTAEGLARWRDQLAFLRSLADGAKLTDAEVERVRAAAQALRNSGFRANIDVKVDAKELPETVVVPAAR